MSSEPLPIPQPSRWHRLHSASGVVPLGAFLVVHLAQCVHALRGREAFESAVPLLRGPIGSAIASAFVLLPLAYHAGYGIVVSLRRTVVPASYFERAPDRWLQRLTGLLSLLFIVGHLWHLRVQTALGTMIPEDYYFELAAALSSTSALGVPMVAMAYLLGMAATAYHFTRGLSGFCHTFRLLHTDAARQRADALFTALGVAVFLVGALTVLGLAAGLASRQPSMGVLA